MMAESFTHPSNRAARRRLAAIARRRPVKRQHGGRPRRPPTLPTWDRRRWHAWVEKYVQARGDGCRRETSLWVVQWSGEGVERLRARIERHELALPARAERKRRPIS